MDQRFLKITYHSSATKKMNAYLKMPSPTYRVLKKEIEMCLFDERQQPRCEIRTFWIDEDQDEIEIISQCDYDIFMAKRSERQHLQVAAIGVATEVAATAASDKNNTTTAPDQSKIPPAAGTYEFAVHDRVECDGCLMAPIMGFRYKCIQCPNYDLCQNCEAKHVHSEHMMVRMPSTKCPGVVEAYVTGRSSGRRHGKRSKSGGCPFVVKNGISVIVGDEDETTGVASGEQSASPAAGGKERHHGRKHGHRRHHRNNFLSHLYEMMHDLAEGGGAAAAEAATGETTTTSSTTTTNGPTTTTSTANLIGFENIESNINATAAAAHMTAQKAHETAVKAAEIAAKVAHETALQTAKNMTENNAMPSTSAAADQGKEKSQVKVDIPTTSQANPTTTTPVLPSPTLETIAQFLDPQYMKTGIQILNNFSDMFAKMLDPMDGAEGGDGAATAYPFASNLRKNSTTSTKSSVSSNLNSMESDKKSEKLSEKSMDKPEQTPETKQPESDVSSNVEIDDLGSDSENDSVSETFIKLDAPKEPKTDIVTSTHTTPPQSLNKSNVMDFAQLSANLKAHIAEEAEKNASVVTPTEIAKVATEQLLTEEISNASPKITTTTTSTSTSSNSSTTSEPKKPQEKRAVPVYHTDQRINNAVIAMMSMGFSNEGAWLTQLLESVNGNIAEALDLMSVAQRTGR